MNGLSTLPASRSNTPGSAFTLNESTSLVTTATRAPLPTRASGMVKEELSIQDDRCHQNQQFQRLRKVRRQATPAAAGPALPHRGHGHAAAAAELAPPAALCVQGAAVEAHCQEYLPGQQQTSMCLQIASRSLQAPPLRRSVWVPPSLPLCMLIPKMGRKSLLPLSLFEHNQGAVALVALVARAGQGGTTLTQQQRGCGQRA
eukprot:CAMPEP_0172868914 /NCGR_PEP_ID=MMETSP1075-20121228/87598_1 /TAXON_ID=2916 /ORGANISM="Ceratium fusus, Strain PA161109" /LENGTH=201 /DNA_ID=CAMNT_0013718681 /DNA_START=155 /DNA_END=761 /DNA_ORIENTATION=+